MTKTGLIIGGDTEELVSQSGRMGSHHGLVDGVTGTGKTVTLQVPAEGFSRMGRPFFAVDGKRDLSGIAAPGKAHSKIDERLAAIPLPDYRHQPCPVLLWERDGAAGHPVRTTISEMGPLLLASVLELNDTQTVVRYVGFDRADDQGLLLDLKDRRALLTWLGENTKAWRAEYGNISGAGLGAIQRRLLFFDEAHLLFSRAPKRLHDTIEQVVRLMRSQGVGVYFITQNFMDLPDAVLEQLGLKVQHALRACTPPRPENRWGLSRRLGCQRAFQNGGCGYPPGSRRGPGIRYERRRPATAGAKDAYRAAGRRHRPASKTPTGWWS